MRKILCSVVMVCTVITLVSCQDTREKTFTVPVSEISEIQEHCRGGYVKVVYNGEIYTGNYSLFDMCNVTLERVILRKTGVSNDIVATEFKEVEY